MDWLPWFQSEYYANSRETQGENKGVSRGVDFWQM